MTFATSALFTFGVIIPVVLLSCSKPSVVPFGKPAPSVTRLNEGGGSRSLHATNAHLQLLIEWTEGSLDRRVTWKVGKNEFLLDVPLRQRPSPWTNETAGVTKTRSGPYQPAYSTTKYGVSWNVVMAHESMDFPSEDQLKMFLDWEWYSDPTYNFLDEEGIFISARVPTATADQNDVGISIFRLLVNGHKPSAALLQDHIKGSLQSH